jgi:replicative DNA helicase
MEWEKIFLAGILEKYPLEIINKRHEIEGNVCACLWKQPDLYKDLKELVLEDFITIDGRFFYALGKQLFTMGYKVFDAITVTTFLNDKAELKEQFKTKNGYSFMTELVPIMNTDNIEIFYDSLVKNNILMRLHDKGFQVVKEMPKFEAMNSELVYQYFDYNLNDVFVKKQIGIKPVDLTGGYDDFLQECDGGKNLGISFGSGCPLLNYHFGGLHKRNILLHTAHSGVGKTSSAIVFYLLPLLEQGEKVVVLVNEQGESDWRSMLLPTIISNKLHYSGLIVNVCSMDISQ